MPVSYFTELIFNKDLTYNLQSEEKGTTIWAKEIGALKVCIKGIRGGLSFNSSGAMYYNRILSKLLKISVL